MRRFLKAAGVVLVSLGGLVVLAVVVSVGTVDRSEWQSQAYAAAAETTLKGLSSSDTPARMEWAELRAGFGRARLSPTLGAASDVAEVGAFTSLPLAGYGNRHGAPATGVHDDLWVRAVALAGAGQTGVVIAADLLIIPREVAERAAQRIEAACRLSRDQLYFGATHSHCSLGGWGEGWVGEAFAGGVRPPVREWMAQQLASAALAAVADLSPASAGSASFEAPEFVRNRLVGDQGRVDPEFALLEVRQADGDRAVLGSYAAHATVLSGSFREFSGDYPGSWSGAVERSGVTLALFLAGGVGSHAPRPPTGGIEGARQMGDRLAERTGEALRDLALTNRLWLGMTTLRVPLPPLQARLSAGWRLRPWLARRLLPVGSDTVLQVLRVGDAVWLSTPCDYSGELALDLKERAREVGVLARVTSFNGDYVGYVVPARYDPLDTYETRTMSFFGPQLPGYFDHLLTELTSIAARVRSGAGVGAYESGREAAALVNDVGRR